MIAKIRKALVAGLTAGLGAGLAVVLKAGNVESPTISQALAAVIAVGGPVAWATWRVPNAVSR
jgi:hypothetical protein